LIDHPVAKSWAVNVDAKTAAARGQSRRLFSGEQTQIG
jgi:hypothetical protein